MKKRILILEPYYGGSHKQFLTGLSRCIDADFHFLTLPARKWKLRMLLSAPWFIGCIKKLENRFFDTVLCSTFVDVAVLKGFLREIKKWNHECLICTYFHENQFIYPSRIEDKSLQAMRTINFTTALASDRIAFNSEFNYQSFIQHCARYIKRAADMDLSDTLVQIQEKSQILFPGVDFAEVSREEKKKKSIPVICWNHRWEHDKDPESFFHALLEIEKLGYDFKIVVLGQSFRQNPSCFTEAQKKFGNKFLHFGFVESRKEYFQWLGKSDIVVSTAQHEFFGISVIEAVRAGCLPIVPDRLSYPELYPDKFRYSEGGLVKKLIYFLEKYEENQTVDFEINTDKFSWSFLKNDYLNWLFK